MLRKSLCPRAAPGFPRKTDDLQGIGHPRRPPRGSLEDSRRVGGVDGRVAGQSRVNLTSNERLDILDFIGTVIISTVILE